MNSILSTFVCTYAFLKYLFGYTLDDNFQHRGYKKQFLLRSIFITLTIATFILFACLLIPLYIFYIIVDQYLKIKLGTLYGGILKRQDATWESLSEKMQIRVVFIYNDIKDTNDFWHDGLKPVIKRFHESSFKFSSTIKSHLGYYYFLKNQKKFDDVVEEIRVGDEDHITKEAFMDYLNNNLDPKPNDDRTWTVHRFPQPIKWNKTKTNKQYAIILTFRHCLSDGPNLMIYAMEYLMDDVYKPPQSNILLEVLKNRPKLTMDDAYMCVNPFYSPQDGFTKDNNTSNTRFIAVISEDTEKYLNLIKQVKTKMGVGFTSVLMGAFSSSLTDHLKKKQKPPIDIVLCTIIRPEIINLVFKSNNEDPLVNDMGYQVITIPKEQVALETTEKCRAIDQRLKVIQRSVDSTLMYMVTKFAHIMPPFVQRLSYENATRSLASSVSNMSAMTNLGMAGHRIESAAVFTSHIKTLAFSLSVLSVDGRLQMTLRSSEMYVSCREELEAILQGTLSYIDKFARDLQID